MYNGYKYSNKHGLVQRSPLICKLFYVTTKDIVLSLIPFYNTLFIACENNHRCVKELFSMFKQTSISIMYKPR